MTADPTDTSPEVWLVTPTGVWPARGEDHDKAPLYVRLRDYRALSAELTAARKANDRLQSNRRETWAAMRAMRDGLDELFPMPSLESDFLQGPEASVFCKAILEAVHSHLDHRPTSDGLGRSDGQKKPSHLID